MPAKPPIHTGPLQNVATALILQPGASLRENEFGSDVWDIPYLVPTRFALGRLPAKYSSPTIGGVTYSQMHLVSRNLTHSEGLMSAFNLTYKGAAYNQTAYKQRMQDGRSLQTVEFGYSNSLLGLELLIRVQYYAATTTRRWFAHSRPNPDVPAYSGVNSRQSPWGKDRLKSFIAVNVATQQPVTNPGTIASLLSTLKTARPGTDVVTDYQVNEEVPGRFWECQSVTMQQIQP